MKKIYLKPEAEIYEMEDNLLEQLFSRVRDNDRTYDPNTTKVIPELQIGTFQDGDQVGAKGGFHSYGGFLEDDFEDEY